MIYCRLHQGFAANSHEPLAIDHQPLRKLTNSQLRAPSAIGQ